jgi:hypothetical protein
MAYQQLSGLPCLTSSQDLVEIYDRHKDYLWCYLRGYAEASKTPFCELFVRHVMAEISLGREENIKEAIVLFVTKKTAQSLVPEIEIKRIG